VAAMKRGRTGGLLSLIVVFELSAFALLAFRNGALDPDAFITAGILFAVFAGSYALLTAAFRHLDGFLLIIVYALISVGMVVQYRINPDIAYKQLIAVAIGVAAMAFVMIFFRKPERLNSLKLCAVVMVGAAGFLALPLAIGSVQGGAKNWIDLGFFSLQPGELVKIALIYALAVYLSERTKLKKLIPVGVFVLCLMALLVLERDLGAALIYAGVIAAMYYAATGNVWITAAGLGVGAGAAALCYALFSHVRARVAAWKNPWSSYYGGGYQIAQGLMAIASGGLFGLGLNLGMPKVIPAYHTDYIFAVICEEMGIIVGFCVIALYVLLLIRGMSIALDASDRFSALLALGCTVYIALQAFIILGGIIKLIPLTGVTLPFVSYGGSSMLTGLVAIAILEVVAAQNGRRREGEREF